MSIPKELKNAYRKGYRRFSWVRPLETNRYSLREYFEKSRSMYIGQRFYWQTPDESQILVGLGKEQEFLDTQAAIKKIGAFARECKTNVYQNRYIEGTGAVLCGAFSFDETSDKTRLWGEMGQGIFYLPRFLLTQKGSNHYLTINFSAQSEEELIAKWGALNTQFLEIQQVRLKQFQTVKITEQEEVAVKQWVEAVNEAVKELQTPHSFEKVVLARQLTVQGQESFQIEAILKNLQQQQSLTYFFVLEKDEHVFVGASPERLLRATPVSFSTASIAGSVSRGTTGEADQKLGEHLLTDLKNRQEHQIVVDRLFSDLRKLTLGEILIQAPKLLKNRDIQHLFLPIEGKRKPDVDFLTAIQQLHPTPALGGEPKDVALQWLKKHEPLQRGLYGAPIGWFSLTEDIGEFAVGIRSALLVKDKGHLFAGCGIVKESDALLEREETWIKFQPMLRGIGGDRYGQDESTRDDELLKSIYRRINL